jgi:hypothetical protein
MQDESELKMTEKVMALFKTRREINLAEILTMLADENPSSVKSAVATLRGRTGKRVLRAKGYVNIVGRSGLEVPVLEVGTLPDVIKTIDTIEVDDEMLRRARELRAKREDIKHRREMAALDDY